MNCAAQSGSSNDTLCFPRPVIEKVLVAAQQKKILESEMAILNERIAEKDAVIRGLDDKDAIQKELGESYKRQIEDMKKARDIYTAEIEALNKALKRQKRKTFWTAMAGVASTTAAIFLLK